MHKCQSAVNVFKQMKTDVQRIGMELGKCYICAVTGDRVLHICEY